MYTLVGGLVQLMWQGVILLAFIYVGGTGVAAMYDAMRKHK